MKNSHNAIALTGGIFSAETSRVACLSMLVMLLCSEIYCSSDLLLKNSFIVSPSMQIQFMYSYSCCPADSFSIHLLRLAQKQNWAHQHSAMWHLRKREKETGCWSVCFGQPKWRLSSLFIVYYTHTYWCHQAIWGFNMTFNISWVIKSMTLWACL